MAQQFVVFDARSFMRMLRKLDRGQAAFVQAKTLTQIASLARRNLMKSSERAWNIRSRGVLRGFQTERATKTNLQSEVGHLDWYALDQLDVLESEREPRTSAFRYIPMAGIKKTRRGRTPKRLQVARVVADLNKEKTKTFIVPEFKSISDPVIARRRTKKRLPIVLLYRMVPKQKIKPKLSIIKEADEAAEQGQKIYNENMEREIRSNR